MTNHIVWDIETGPIGEDADGRAALSPLTGRILAIGVLPDSGVTKIFDGGPENNERVLIEEFLGWMQAMRHSDFVGFNSDGFDIPFVMRRAWILGIDPKMVNVFMRVRSTPDLMKIWMYRDDNRISLARMAHAFYLGTKACTGADFEDWWMDPTTKYMAENYLKTDLWLTAKCAMRMLDGCNFNLEALES